MDVPKNAVKIYFFIQNVNGLILKGTLHYVPHPVCVTFLLRCFCKIIRDDYFRIVLILESF